LRSRLNGWLSRAGSLRRVVAVSALVIPLTDAGRYRDCAGVAGVKPQPQARNGSRPKTDIRLALDRRRGIDAQGHVSMPLSFG